MSVHDIEPAELPGRIRLASWAWFGAFFGAALEALDARLLYGENLTSSAILLDVLKRIVVGSAAGAFVCCILGAVAMGIDQLLPPPRRQRKRVSIAWLLGLGLGVLVGGYNVATSPYTATHDHMITACRRIQADLNLGQLALDTRATVKGLTFASDALSLIPLCKLPEADADEAQAYLLRAIGAYQLREPYAADAQHARVLAQGCAQRYASSHDLQSKRCRSVVQGSEETLAQHFCDEALHLSNDAEDSIGFEVYDLGRSEANQAITSAAECKSPYAYAYRGIGLLKRGMAEYLDGRRARGVTDLRNARVLLDRCVADIDVGSAQSGLRRKCASQLTQAKPLLMGARMQQGGRPQGA